MTNSSKRYFGDSPKAAKIYARKYFPTAEIAEPESTSSRIQNFPTASELAEYDAVFEGGAEQILKLIEREQNQRHKWENKALKIQTFGRRFGQILFALMVISLIYANVILTQSGHVFGALSLAVLGFVGLAASLFFTNKQRFNIEKRHHFTNRYNSKYRGK